MSKWTKESDWVPLSNALALVDFYIDNLKKAEDFLDYVETFAQYNLAGYEKMYQAAMGHLAKQKEGLQRAQAKLEETKKRVTPPS